MRTKTEIILLSNLKKYALSYLMERRHFGIAKLAQLQQDSVINILIENVKLVIFKYFEGNAWTCAYTSVEPRLFYLQ